MGIISLLLKFFFFYMLYNVLSGIWKAYQNYRALQKHAQEASQGSSSKGSNGPYNQTSYSSGESIEAEFEVLDEKDL